MPCLDKANEPLKNVCLQWVTAGSGEKEHDLQEKRADRDALAVDEWFGVTSIQSDVRTEHVFRANIAVHPFTTELSQSTHQLYITRFSWKSTMKGSKIHE